MERELAPIALFVYNRAEHALQTLTALSKNELASESTLYIFSDGPKDFDAETIKAVEQVRSAIKSKRWCKEVFVIESKTNRGLADSIVQGVTDVIDKYGKVIVLEDDIVTAPGFLKYMNDALNVYEDNDQVMHISAYMYPVTDKVINGTVFLKVLSCWGWATWARAWHSYEANVDIHLSRFKSQKDIDRFNVMGNASFYNQLLANKKGEIRSWAVKWFASWYFKGGISLFPMTTLVTNIGHDGSGIHCGPGESYRPNFVAASIEVNKTSISENNEYLVKIDRFYLLENKRIESYQPKNSLLKMIKLKTLKIFKEITGVSK